MAMDLSGKIALITGGAGGIGRTVAMRFAQAGALVCIHYGTNSEGANATVNKIVATGGQAFAVQADIRSPKAIVDLFSAFDRELSSRGKTGLDILVNNAGIGGLGSMSSMTEEEFERLVSTNVRGTFFVTQQALRRIRDGGRIINISSSVSLMAYPSTVVYAMTKSAINSMSVSLAAELGPRGITVNAVAPGATDTEFLSALTPEFKAEVVAGIALGRMGTPEEIAGVIAFLASPDGGWITGQIIAATGGTHL